MKKLELATLMSKRKKSTIIADIRWLIKMYSATFVNLDFLNIKFNGDAIRYNSYNGTITYNVLIQVQTLKMPNNNTLFDALKGVRTTRNSLLVMLFVEEMIIQAFQTYFAHYASKTVLKKVLPCVAKEYFGHTKYPYFT